MSPQYEWKCTQCGNKFTLRHRTMKVVPPKCPKCKGTTEKQFSVPNIVVR